MEGGAKKKKKEQIVDHCKALNLFMMFHFSKKVIYHSLGLQGMVQWSQPACWPSDWSSAAC